MRAVGGRVERVTWAHYVAQGKGLLDHLNISRAHIMGGCMGCCPVTAFAVAHPQTTLSMVLYWPVGGAKYRISSHQRFAEHLAFVQQHGLDAVVALVTKDGKSFGADPRGGPWAAVIKADPAFAAAYAAQDIDDYKLIVVGMARTMFDRDTAPGAEPEDLLAARHPRARHSRPRRCARNLGGALPGRMPAARGILGCPGRRADGGGGAAANNGISRASERRGVSWDRNDALQPPMRTTGKSSHALRTHRLPARLSVAIEPSEKANEAALRGGSHERVDLVLGRGGR
jgi:pimeloyl-ACP methyl ester carboxylesterase